MINTLNDSRLQIEQLLQGKLQLQLKKCLSNGIANLKETKGPNINDVLQLSTCTSSEDVQIYLFLYSIKVNVHPYQEYDKNWAFKQYHQSYRDWS